MSSEGAISPMATETPPAPKSLQILILRVSSGLRKRRWILRSVGASPFWTSAEFSSAVSVCSLEEPVAPPTPSRPVRPPMSRMTSPGAGVPRKTLRARRGGDDGADFQALGDVAGVIDLGDLAGGEADLVAVGRVAVGGDLADFLLRELAGEGFGKWC
jgi:hypothetical protein